MWSFFGGWIMLLLSYRSWIFLQCICLCTQIWVSALSRAWKLSQSLHRHYLISSLTYRFANEASKSKQSVTFQNSFSKYFVICFQVVICLTSRYAVNVIRRKRYGMWWWVALERRGRGRKGHKAMVALHLSYSRETLQIRNSSYQG